MDFDRVLEKFDEYVNTFDLKDKRINMKYRHSLDALYYAKKLALRLELNEEDTFIIKVIALLHDIGRFEQIKVTDSFKDSKYDHAEHSIVYLFELGHIRDFIDDDKYDDIIKDAIGNHNKYRISDYVSGRNLYFAKLIRDIDKIAIFKQEAIYGDFSFTVDVSEEVLKEFSEHKLVDKKKIKSISDEVVSVLAFVYDINFNESYDLMAEEDVIQLFVSCVDVSKDAFKLYKKLVDDAYEQVERGI